MTISCDYLIIGAGIIGLSIALEIKRREPYARILISEKECKAGMHASGRNSGVMHSGIYYSSETLKAQFCAAGAALMRQFAKEHGIAYHPSGKVIIATSEKDLPVIERLLENARTNGIRGEKLNEQEVKAIEPHATPYKVGIYSPSTFIIDSKAVIQRLEKILMDYGVSFVFGSEITQIDTRHRTVRLKGEAYHYGYLFNCAGTNADRIARLFGLCKEYTLIPFKGIYYKLRPERQHLVRANIYPVPDVDLPFLGVHLTRVISGEVYVGPTAMPAFGRENYGFLQGITFREGVQIMRELFDMYCRNQQNFRKLVHTEMRKYIKSSFTDSASKLVGELETEDLISCDKVGIRPQLVNIR